MKTQNRSTSNFCRSSREAIYVIEKSEAAGTHQ